MADHPRNKSTTSLSLNPDIMALYRKLAAHSGLPLSFIIEKAMLAYQKQAIKMAESSGGKPRRPFTIVRPSLTIKRTTLAKGA